MHSHRRQDQPADAAPQQQLLDAGQLDQLVAPIALYSDPLLAQVLMASTYPLEVVQADRWAKANKSLKGDALTTALDKQDWDASVKELVSTPTVLAMMNDKLDWTQALGDAVLAQQADVMDAIQRLRAKAQANGKLETTKQQKVTVKQDQGSAPVIEIEPASPEVVYVPVLRSVGGLWRVALSRLSALLLSAAGRLGRRRRDRDRTCLGRGIRRRPGDLGRYRLASRQHRYRHRPQRRISTSIAISTSGSTIPITGAA